MTDPLRDTARRFSASFPVMHDLERREKKGRKVAAILTDALAGRPAGVVLDVGCSNAVILDMVSDRLRPTLAIGLDLDTHAMPPPRPRRQLLVADGMALPLADESVDVVICNHTYEHVPDARKLFAQIWRVLRPGGLVYFSAMNAHWPIEPHYRLPLLHWLPRRAARWMLRMAGHNTEYIERPLGTAALGQLVSSFEVRDYTLQVIAAPERFEADDVVPHTRLRRIYPWIARLAYGLLPGYLWVLVKPGTVPGSAAHK